MTVAELFTMAKLSPSGPVAWGTPISECSEGVYVVARVGDPNGECEACELLLKDPPPNLRLDLEYERQRWLPKEPVLYIGKTEENLCVRIAQFYCHKVGDKRPHAGGQVAKLLQCNMWVYWSGATDPGKCEKMMLSAFQEREGHRPFANAEPGKPKRIQGRI